MASKESDNLLAHRFRALLDEADYAIYVADPSDGGFLDVNEAACRMLGYDRDTLLGMTLEHLRPVPLRGPTGQLGSQVELLRREGSFTVSTLHLHAEGHVLPVEIRVSLHTIEDREYLLGVCRALTGASAEERRLRLHDRLATVGNLARGLAHELNNPLTYVVANLEYVAHHLGTDASDETVEALAEAQEGLGRLHRVIRDVTRLADEGADHAAPVKVEAALDTAVRMVEPRVRGVARVVRRYSGVPRVYCDEAHLCQVFVNLIVNAAQAIGSDSGTELAHRIVLTTRLLETGRVRVSVQDTGRGIDPEAIERIFEPFFTTKAGGEGSGLGLSICHRLVTRMGGRIVAENTDGGGAVFHVDLPIAAKQQVVEQALEVLAAAPDATAPALRVLVVDDDVLTCRALGRTLSQHDVTIATRGTEALERLRHEHFDVVLLDLMMPDISGMEVFERVSEERAETAARVLFLTGGAFTADAARFVQQHADRCIHKPVDGSRLRALVRAHAERAGYST